MSHFSSQASRFSPERHSLKHQPQLDHTAEILIETARILSEDIAAWQELYGRKRLNLPA